MTFHSIEITQFMLLFDLKNKLYCENNSRLFKINAIFP